MCGRYTVSKVKSVVLSFLKTHFDIDIEDIELPKYNIAPSQNILTIIYDGHSFRAGYMKFGYEYPYKDKINMVINARSETIEQKNVFNKNLKTRRCLIISDGYYEWHKESKIPHYIKLNNHNIFFFAGIYSKIKVDNINRFGCLIITKQSNNLLSSIHDRMPLILNVSNAKAYLKGDDSYSVKALAQLTDELEMGIEAVSKLVNKVENDSPELIKKTASN